MICEVSMFSGPTAYMTYKEFVNALEQSNMFYESELRIGGATYYVHGPTEMIELDLTYLGRIV